MIQSTTEQEIENVQPYAASNYIASPEDSFPLETEEKDQRTLSPEEMDAWQKILENFNLERVSSCEPLEKKETQKQKATSYIKEILAIVSDQYVLSKDISSGKHRTLEETLKEYHHTNMHTAHSYKELGIYNMVSSLASIGVSCLGFVPALASETGQLITKTCAEQTPNLGSMFKTHCDSKIYGGQQTASLYMDRYRTDSSDKQSEAQARQEQASLAKSTLEALIAASRV